MSETAKSLRHLGIILDGNRRWARENGLPTVDGHKKGSEVFKEIAFEAFDQGIEYVSAYVFSNENWTRAEEEVSYLMKLVIKAVEKYLNEFNEKGVRILILGRKDGLRQDVLKAIERTVEKTAGNTKATLALCFNYGGKQEIIDAANQAIKAGKTELTPEDVEQYLYSPDVPDVDLVVRTSGEQRTSGFMLWRAAYAELLFVEKYWPDFTAADLQQAIDWYNNRKRRFGG